jgi:acylphosphatase
MPLVPEDGDIARLVRITGRVQGVWYRGWAGDEAILRGLRGWVRNRRDGSVEALFFGSSVAVQDMIDACRNGPPAAEVQSVEAEAAEAPECAGFEQRPTA